MELTDDARRICYEAMHKFCHVASRKMTAAEHDGLVDVMHVANVVSADSIRGLRRLYRQQASPRRARSANGRSPSHSCCSAPVRDPRRRVTRQPVR